MIAVRLHKNGAEAFPAMFDALDRAERSIALEMYIFADDGTGREFRDRLVAAARRGVQVQVLVDSWGSWNLAERFWDDLRAAGGTVRWFHPLARGLFPFRNHRKLLLIDDRRAFLGGMNVSDEYYRGSGDEPPWRDNVFEVDDAGAAGLHRSFLRMWALADSPLRRLVMRFRLGRGGLGSDGGPVRFLESGPDNPLRPVRKAYVQVIRNARSSIDLAMGYFYPHGRILRALKRAVRRGVRVRLLVPLHTDVPITRWAARGLYGRLLRAGVEVWEYLPSMMHSKLAIADDTVIAGSANLDIRSGRINYEIVAIMEDRDLAARVRKDFEEDLGRSVRIGIDEWNSRSLLQKLKERISYCLLARFDIFIARRELLRRFGSSQHR